MSRKRILILGAGLAGLSAAWHLQKRGIDCQVFEKEPQVGGLCRSKRIKGFTFDYDGHVLHFKYGYTFNTVKELLGGNLAQHQRNAWVYSCGRYIRYPFQANLYGLPPAVVKECISGFIDALKNGKSRKRELSFLDWINHTFGKGIGRHFMVPYNTKFWTIPPQRLTCDWTSRFVPIPSPNQILKGATQENQGQFGYNARFWYPKKNGIDQLPMAFAKKVKNIHLNREIVEIDFIGRNIKFASGAREGFDYLVSTIPLPEMRYLIKKLPANKARLFGKLKWNSIFNLNLGIEKRDSAQRHWIYFPQQDISFFRTGFFHNFSSFLASPDKGSLYTEVAYSEEKPIDKSVIVQRIKQDLKKVGILNYQDRICAQDINDIKYGYPIYDKNSRQVRDAILEYLAENNVIPCGRYGSWRYFSMEGAIIDGKRAAKILSKNG